MKQVRSFCLRRGGRIGNYRVIRCLGRGYEGEVYAVREVPSGVMRAMKIVRCVDADTVEHITRTARLLEFLRDTGASPRYYHMMTDCFVGGGWVLCLVLEKLDGVVLKAWLRRKLRCRSFGERQRLVLLHMLTHLRIQYWFGVCVAVLVLGHHATVRLIPARLWARCHELEMLLPYLIAAIVIILLILHRRNRIASYRELLKNSPGVAVNTEGIEYGVGHPSNKDT